MAAHLTVMESLILENSPSLIPLTFMTSSIELKGRASMIACALTGPMPKRASSCSLLAVLILILVPGGSAGALRCALVIFALGVTAPVAGALGDSAAGRPAS